MWLFCQDFPRAGLIPHWALPPELSFASFSLDNIIQFPPQFASHTIDMNWKPAFGFLPGAYPRHIVVLGGRRIGVGFVSVLSWAPVLSENEATCHSPTCHSSLYTSSEIQCLRFGFYQYSEVRQGHLLCQTLGLTWVWLRLDWVTILQGVICKCFLRLVFIYYWGWKQWVLPNRPASPHAGRFLWQRADH